MTEEEYHNHTSLSASIIKRLVVNDETYEVANGIKTEPTPAMELGTLVHCLILEPEKFKDTYAVMPKCDLRTTAGKALKADFEQNANGKKVVSETDFDTAMKCVESFKNNTVSNLIKKGKPEQKFFSELDNVPIRGMLDWYDEERGMIVDLKTTQNFADMFVKECGDRMYNIQASFYVDLLTSLGKNVSDFIFVGIQTKAPYKITVVRLNQIDIEDGREAYKVGIDIWKDIKANPEKYNKELCVNPSDGGVVFDYVTPMWARYKLDKLKQGKVNG